MALFLLPGFLCTGFVSGSPAEKPVFKNETRVIVWLKEKTSANTFKRIRFDIDGDEKADLIVGMDCEPGVLCIYSIFTRKKNQYVYKGTVPLVLFKFEVLKTMHHGLSDIIQYNQPKPETHALTRYEYDGEKYNARSTTIGGAKIFDLIRPTSLSKN